MKLSDNYFDLIPGNKAKVFLKQGKNLKDLKDTMKFRSYKQVYDNAELTVNVKENWYINKICLYDLSKFYEKINNPTN